MVEELRNMPESAECTRRISLSKVCAFASKDARRNIRERVQALRYAFDIPARGENDERFAVVEVSSNGIEIDRVAFAAIARFVADRALLVVRSENETALFMSYKDGKKGVRLLRTDATCAEWRDGETTARGVRSLCSQLFENFSPAHSVDSNLSNIARYRKNMKDAELWERRAREERQASKALECRKRAKEAQQACDKFLLEV